MSKAFIGLSPSWLSAIIAGKEGEEEEERRMALSDSRLSAQSSAFAILLYFVLVIVVIAGALYAISTVSVERVQPTMFSVPREGFRYRELIDELETSVTPSFNPCVDLFRYVCNDVWNDLQNHNFGLSEVEGHIRMLTLNGTLRNPASDALRLIHLSCFDARIVDSDVLLDAAKALDEALPEGHRARLNPVEMMTNLSLHYDIDAPIHVEVQGLRVNPLCHVGLKKVVVPNLERDNSYVWAEVLKILQMENSLGEVGVLHLAIEAAERPKTTVGGKATEHTFNVRSKLWKNALRSLDIWQPRMKILFKNASILGTFLNELLHVGRERAAIGYICVLAVNQLASKMLDYKSRHMNVEPWLDYCSGDVLGKYELWTLTTIFTYRTPEKDRAMRRMANTLIQDIRNEAPYYFGGVNNTKIERAIDGLHVQLPSQIFSAYDESPVMSLNYWKNELTFRKWRKQFNILRSIRGSIDLQGKRFVPNPGKFRFIDPIAYTFLRSDIHEEAFVNLADFAVYFAHHILQELFKSVPLSSRTRQFLLTKCLKNVSKATDAKSVSLYLSLRLTLKLRRFREWHELVEQKPRLGTVSRSRLFYMAFYKDNICIPAARGMVDNDYVQMFSSVITHFPDFARAFECPSVSLSEACGLV